MRARRSPGPELRLRGTHAAGVRDALDTVAVPSNTLDAAERVPIHAALADPNASPC